MSDRTAAGIYSNVFQELAKDPDVKARKLAETFWDQSLHYDFSPEQLCCNTALEDLGLARPDPTEEGCYLYGPEDLRVEVTSELDTTANESYVTGLDAAKAIVDERIEQEKKDG